MAAEPSMVARAESGAPPRARILKTARELFYRDGIHAVSVDAIAEAAGSNKTTLYRHFESKDELVAECLRELTRDFDLAWADIERKHAGEPKQQLLALRAFSKFFGPWSLPTRRRKTDPQSRDRRFAVERSGSQWCRMEFWRNGGKGA